jgi:hypothetical protein
LKQLAYRILGSAPPKVNNISWQLLAFKRKRFMAILWRRLLALSQGTGRQEPIRRFSVAGYTSVSDVVSHNQVPADIGDIVRLLAVAKEGGLVDYAAVAGIYREGLHSIKQKGTVRSLRSFAANEKRFINYFPQAVAYYNSPKFLNAFIISAIAGHNMFASAPHKARAQAINSGLLSLMKYWVQFKLASAAQKAANDNFKPANGAPSNWDEAFALYYGPEGKFSLYALGEALSNSFKLKESINLAILAAFREGQAKLIGGQSADAEKNTIITQLNRTFWLGLLQAATEMSASLAAGDHDQARAAQAKGQAFYFVLAPTLARISPETDKLIDHLFMATPNQTRDLRDGLPAKQEI